MKRVWQILFGVFVLGWSSLVLGAGKPLTIDVWPGQAPGEKGDIGPEKVLEDTSKNPVKRITNVTKPTLTIFQPAAEKNTGTAVVIAPGGGYHILAWDLEGEEVAAWLNSIGVTGIILKYRVPRRPGSPRMLPEGGPDGRPAQPEPGPPPSQRMGYQSSEDRHSRFLGGRPPDGLDGHQFRSPRLPTPGRGRPRQLPAGLRRAHLPCLFAGQEQGESGSGDSREQGVAAHVLRPCRRRWSSKPKTASPCVWPCGRPASPPSCTSTPPAVMASACGPPASPARAGPSAVPSGSRPRNCSDPPRRGKAQ